MKLYRTVRGVVLEDAGSFFPMPDEWDALINRDDLSAHLASAATGRGDTQLRDALVAPIGSQEVWAAGVTYSRSRTARTVG